MKEEKKQAWRADWRTKVSWGLFGTVVIDETIFPITHLCLEDGLLVIYCRSVGLAHGSPPGLTQIEVYDPAGNLVTFDEAESPGWEAVSEHVESLLRLPIGLSPNRHSKEHPSPP